MSPTGKAFYVTTPIYYVNDAPHIGHAYTTVAADTICRWHRQRGEDVWLLTGTDEHGEKVLRTAEAAGVTPQQWADRLVAEHWKPVLATLDVANDDFIRTTERRHESRVQSFLTRLKDAGHIYSGDYEGPYCVGCEEFKLAGDLVPGTGDLEGQMLCPVHSRPVELVSETNWFFRLSAFGDALLAALRGPPGGGRPAERAQRGHVLHPQRSAGPVHLPVELRLGHPRAVGHHAGRLRVVRRPAQLRHRRGPRR